MSYIGVQPTAGQYRKLDNISSGFNGSTTSFTTSVSGTNVTAGTAQQLLVSLGGVIQQPDTDYTVSTNTITFTTAPTSGLTFFAVLMGDALNTVTTSDGAITTAKLAGSLSVGLAAGTASAPSLYFTGDTNTGIYSLGSDQVAISTGGTGRLFVDSSGRVGIGTSAPGYKTEISGTSGTAGLGLTGTYASGDIGYYFAPSAVTGSVKAFQSAASATTGVTALFANANSATGTAHARVEAEVGGSSAGDPKFVMTVSGATNWSVGVDNSDSDKFKISSSDSPGSSDRLTIDTSGNVGIGTTSPAQQLHVRTDQAGYTWTRIDNQSSSASAYAGLMLAAFGNTWGLLNGSSAANGNTLSFVLDAGGANSEKMRLDTSGRLLVGTSSTLAGATDSLLQIRGNSSGSQFAGKVALATEVAAGSIVSGTDLGAIYFGNVANGIGGLIECKGDAQWGTNDYPGRLVFSVTSDGASSPTERLRIDSEGRHQLTSAGSSAFTSQGYGWHVRSTNYYTAAIEYEQNSATGEPLNIFHRATSGNNNFILFKTEAGAGTTRGSITYNRAGGLTAYNTTSDYRAKTLLGDVENPGETLDALKVYRGVMNGATVERPMLVAHEAQEVAPYCVTGEKDAVDDDGKPIYQQMDHQALVPLLIAEIQQLRARVAALESA